MSLFRAELRRLRKRRFTRWMLLLVLVIMAVTVAGMFATNTKPGPEALAQARAEAERDYAEQQRWMEQEIAECERAQEDGGEDPRWEGIADCEEIRQWYGQDIDEMARWYLPPSFDFRESFPEMLTVFAALLAMFAFIVGASFVGAEWRSGGMANLLVWRPRRWQVLLSKLGTVLAAVFGLGVVLGGAWTAAFWWVALERGVTDSMTSGAWQSMGLTGLRGVILALVAGALGFAVASIGRHTAMALGAAVALVIGGYGLGIVLFMAGASAVERWLYPTYLLAWMDKSVTIYDYQSCDWSQGGCTPAEIEITWQTSGLLMAAAVVLLVGAAMWHIRRRDVT